MTCHSCGGIVGRDCFNPSECAMIADMQARQQYEEYPEPTERELREHFGLPTDDLDEPTKGADRE